MIKFIPFHLDNSEQTELDFCENMNYEKTALRCIKALCKRTDTYISVDGKNPDFFLFEIVSICCQDFKDRLNNLLGKNLTE